jgi:hypothetical protein
VAEMVEDDPTILFVDLSSGGTEGRATFRHTHMQILKLIQCTVLLIVHCVQAGARTQAHTCLYALI